MSNSKSLLSRTSLPQRILIGLILVTILGLLVPQATASASWATSSWALSRPSRRCSSSCLSSPPSATHNQKGFDRRFGFVIFEYLLTTLLAAFVAVAASFAFPVSMSLEGVKAVENAPGGIF